MPGFKHDLGALRDRLRDAVETAAREHAAQGRTNIAVAANVGRDGAVRVAVARDPAGGKDDASEGPGANSLEEVKSMPKKNARRQRGLSRKEIAREHGTSLPDREAMSLINANLAVPVNAAVAANVLSDGAIAYADATQDTPITQGN